MITHSLSAQLLVFILLVTASFCTDAALCEQPTSNSNAGQSTTDNTNQYIEHTFASGARWTLCVQIDEQSGLTVNHVQYGAPNEPIRKVFESAAIAQLLFKYDEDTRAQHWLASHGLGGNKLLDTNATRCPTGRIISTPINHNICFQTHDLNNLTSLRRSESLRRNAFSIRSWSAIGAFHVEQVWQFTEDGQITPSVRLGGVLNRFTSNASYGSDINQGARFASNATLLATWKLDFNINDTPNNDIVESIEFIPQISNVVRRSISVKGIATESLHKVDREQFKGWLVRDRDESSGPDRTTRIGYYLDPQVSGFANISRTDNWSVFDLAVTNRKDCEQLASGNSLHNQECGNSLDDFVNGESLVNGDPVIWFSVARQFLPKAEDFPAISTRESRFTLIPFDWSASTPFSPLTE